MKSFPGIAAAVVAAATLAGCSGLKYGEVANTKPTGDEFSTTLFKEYIALSKGEYDEGDYFDSDKFAARAETAAGGQPAAPEAVASRQQTARNAKALTAAHGRLVKTLAGKGRELAPRDAARAQAMFECWAQEQEENFQPDHIDACRIAFFTAMARIDARVAAAMKPPPKAKPAPRTFTVYFKLESAQVDAAGKAVANDAAGAIAGSKPRDVRVTGHTDRSGSERYNRRLGERRANAVAKALTDAGVSGRLLGIASFGEHQPAVPTADGVREPRNRRVEIKINY